MGGAGGEGRATLHAPSPTLQFAAAARVIAAAARRLGHDAPAFRSPPRALGAHRTIRRSPVGVVVAVVVRGRPFAAVLADMIEGVVLTNALASPQSDLVRSELWGELVRHGFVGTDPTEDGAAVVVPGGAARYRPVA